MRFRAKSLYNAGLKIFFLYFYHVMKVVILYPPTFILCRFHFAVIGVRYYAFQSKEFD